MLVKLLIDTLELFLLFLPIISTRSSKSINEFSKPTQKNLNKFFQLLFQLLSLNNNFPLTPSKKLLINFPRQHEILNNSADKTKLSSNLVSITFRGNSPMSKLIFSAFSRLNSFRWVNDMEQSSPFVHFFLTSPLRMTCTKRSVAGERELLFFICAEEARECKKTRFLSLRG